MNCALNGWITLVGIALLTGPFALRSLASEVWRDDFEAYALGALPSPWVLSGNTSAVVTDSQRVSGSKSVSLSGAINGCWGALAHRPIGTNPPFEIEFATRCGSESLGGCHPEYVTVQLHAGPSWAYSGRTLMRFHNDGKIYGGNWTAPTSGVVLGSFVSDMWYKVKIRYEIESETNIALSFWIDDQFRGQTNHPAEPIEASLSYLSIESNEGTTYYDDVRVSAIITPPVATVLSIRVSQIELCWDTLANHWYQLQYREDLSTNGWLPLGGLMLGTGTRFCTNDAIFVGQPRRFYQLSITNAP